MTEKCLAGKSSDDLSGTLFSRCFRYTIIPVLTYNIERKFGEAKTNHGLRRCRYVGRARYAIQAYLTAIVLNLKRMVKLLTGVSFKGRARAMA